MLYIEPVAGIDHINNSLNEYTPVSQGRHWFPFSLNTRHNLAPDTLSTKAPILQTPPCVSHTRGSFTYHLQHIKITRARKRFVGTGPVGLDANYLRDNAVILHNSSFELYI